MAFKFTQVQMWWCHLTLHIWFTIGIYNNYMSISHCLALIATQHFFLISLVIRPHCEKLQMHQMTPKWHWKLQGQRYTAYVLLLPDGPKFHSVSLYDRSFFWFLHSAQWWMWNFQTEIVKNRKLKMSKISNVHVVFWGPFWDKIQDKFGNFSLRFVGGVAFWNVGSHRVPC